MLMAGGRARKRDMRTCVQAPGPRCASALPPLPLLPLAGAAQPHYQPQQYQPHSSSGAGGARAAQAARPEQVIDIALERITERLRAELKLELQVGCLFATGVHVEAAQGASRPHALCAAPCSVRTARGWSPGAAGSCTRHMHDCWSTVVCSGAALPRQAHCAAKVAALVLRTMHLAACPACHAHGVALHMVRHVAMLMVRQVHRARCTGARARRHAAHRQTHTRAEREAAGPRGRSGLRCRSQGPGRLPGTGVLCSHYDHAFADTFVLCSFMTRPLPPLIVI